MTKYCLLDTCGKELVRKSNEGNVLFGKRKFCGRPCSIDYFRKNGHWREYGVKLSKGVSR